MHICHPFYTALVFFVRSLSYNLITWHRSVNRDTKMESSIRSVMLKYLLLCLKIKQQVGDLCSMAFIFVGYEGGEIIQSYICPEIHSVQINGPTGRDLSKRGMINVSYLPTDLPQIRFYSNPPERKTSSLDEVLE